MNLPTLVINLDKDTERLAQARAQLDSFIRVPAILGSKATKDESTRMCNLFCTDSMIGCMLSHIKCWKYIVDHKLPFAIILEDDFILDQSDFYNKTKKLINNTPKDWDIILLGCFFCNQDNNDIMSKFIMNIITPSGKSQQKVNNLVYKPKTWSGAHAYVLNLEGAKKLLNALPKASYHVDMELSRLSNLELYAVIDPIVKQNTTGGSNNTTSVPFFNVLPKIDHSQLDFDFILTMPICQLLGFKIHVYFLLKLIIVILLMYYLTC